MAEKVLSKIGTWGEDGAVTAWPDTDVFGAPYDKPANLYALNGRHFVALPPRPLVGNELAEALAGLDYGTAEAVMAAAPTGSEEEPDLPAFADEEEDE